MNIEPLPIEPLAGEHVTDYCRRLVDKAREYDAPFSGEFNGITVTARPDSRPADLAYIWSLKELIRLLNHQAGEAWREFSGDRTE